MIDTDVAGLIHYSETNPNFNLLKRKTFNRLKRCIF